MANVVDMSVDLGGFTLKNPVNTASGTFGMGWQFENFFDVATLGAITCKGCAPSPWPGNPEPRMAKVTSGMLNSVGLANPGIRQFCESLGSYLEGLEERGCRIIVQAVGHSLDEYIKAVELFDELAPWASAIELNISCPNVSEGGATMVGCAKDAVQFMRALRPRAKRPLLVKMAPHDVVEIGQALEAEGANALTLINTIPAMTLDVWKKTSKLSRPIAGLSGPAIHPIAVRMVYELAQKVTVPLCGMGGIERWEDAAEFILAGASAVSVGTANFSRPTLAKEVVEGLNLWTKEQGVSSIGELKGAIEL